jgi:DNA-binding Lrp family transcriptional regulator
MSTLHLDELDEQILATLRKDGRCSNSEIARLTGASEGTIRRRIARMLDLGVGQIVMTVNPLKLGYVVEVFISLRVELGKAETVAAEIAKLEEVNYVGVTSGDFDVLIHAVFQSNEEVLQFVSHKLPHIGGVRESQTSYVMKVAKRTNRWIPVEDQDGRQVPVK